MFIEKVHFMNLRSVQRLLVYRAVTIVCLLTIVTGGIIIGIFVGHVSGAQLNNNRAPIGMPYIVVPGSQPEVPVRFYSTRESDPGPYPIPPNAPIENGPDTS